MKPCVTAAPELWKGAVSDEVLGGGDAFPQSSGRGPFLMRCWGVVMRFLHARLGAVAVEGGGRARHAGALLLKLSIWLP